MPIPVKHIPVYNPATEEIIAELPLGGKADVDKAVKRPAKLSLSGQKSRRQNVRKLP